MFRAPNVIDEQEVHAVEAAHVWARRTYHAAKANPALGNPWKTYCRVFDHELWMRLAADRAMWT